MIIRFPAALWKHRELVWRLTEREILGRYRGSLGGVGWSFLQPLAMLAVYTFVFSQIFKARWGTLDNTGALGFAINLFAGLIVFNFFAECTTKAPTLVLANANFVKKVIFPLEVLGLVVVGGAAFHAATSLVVLMAFELAANHGLPVTYLWLPLVWLPLILGSLAATWLLATLGVFLRDIGQFVGVAVSMLMFLSPIFYPLSALTPDLQRVIALNPLAQIIEATRRVTVEGMGPGLLYVFVGITSGICACELAFRIFMKAKHAFADVM